MSTPSGAIIEPPREMMVVWSGKKGLRIPASLARDPRLGKVCRPAVLDEGADFLYISNEVSLLFRLAAIVLFFLPLAAWAQDIVTASRYFDTVSEKYGSVADYSAKVSIVQGKTTMDGILLYKNPNKLRIEFSNPAGQVINSDGKTLTVFLPRYSVAFTQELKKRSDAAIAAMASKQGLNLLKSSYSIGYVTGPEPVPLDGTTGENVVKLKLTWRSGTQAYRQLEISIAANGFIRRIIGITGGQQSLQFDFSSIKTNIGIPDTRFDYDSPPTANMIHNFLFEPEG
jgi:outer membrane lipoprotein-sorting protein